MHHLHLPKSFHWIVNFIRFYDLHTLNFRYKRIEIHGYIIHISAQKRGSDLIILRKLAQVKVKMIYRGLLRSSIKYVLEIKIKM